MRSEALGEAGVGFGDILREYLLRVVDGRNERGNVP